MALFLLLIASSVPSTTLALSNSAAVQQHQALLAQSFSSPSGKLTLSPEILIDDPSTPTGLLLQSSAVSSLSEALRTKAKANGAFVSCASLSSLKIFCKEQEDARGNFPGPIPVIYCGKPKDADKTPLPDDDDADADVVDWNEVAAAGAAGILVSTSIVSSIDDVTQDATFAQRCQAAWEAGLPPIPEITVLDTLATTWKEDDMEQLVAKITNSIGEGGGGPTDPAMILLSIQQTTSSTATTNVDNQDDNNNKNKEEEEESEEGEEATLPLPTISRALGRRIPILGSIRTSAGANRLGEETARWKAAGFTGALLRQECLPGWRNKPSIEYVSDFWAACIGDLKSTRSKTFDFRSRNLMEKSMPVEWAKYQKSVLDSGALGEAEDNSEGGFNPNNGDYQGF